MFLNHSHGHGSRTTTKKRRSTFLGKSTETLIQPNREHKKYLDAVATLLHAFPGFPTKMMETMIIRCNGNCYTAFKTLISKGWEPMSNISRKKFPKQDSDYFTIPYYHGPAPSEEKINVLFENRKPGTFITFYRKNKNVLVLNCGSTLKDCQYYLCYKNAEGNIVECTVHSVNIPKTLKSVLGLKGFISPSSQNLSFIPGFVCSVE